MNFLTQTIKVALAKHGMTQSAAAKRMEMSTALLSKIMRGDSKMLPQETLTALCTRWPDSETGLRILEAYLKDEVVRAGRALDEITISVHEPVEDVAFDMHLQAIRRVIMQEPDMRTVIAHMGRAASDILQDRQPATRKAAPEPLDMTDPVEWHTLPCYGVAAGRGVTGDEWEEKFKRNYGDDYFALRVCGDSMEPDVADGSVIVIRKTETLRTPAPRKGDIYCFLINGERVLKRYNTRKATPEEIAAEITHRSPGSKVDKVKVLESTNPKHPEIVLNGGEEPQNLGWYDPKNQPNNQ